MGVNSATGNTTVEIVGNVKVTNPDGSNIAGGGGSADFGTAITGQALESGGVGNLGWLSSIRKAITDRLGTLGQKAMSASTPVVIASDQSAVPATQSGTWTVQPGNTANTTAWKVDGSAVTQPTSLATLPALVAGSAIIGKVDLDQTSPATALSQFTTALSASAAVSAKGSAGNLYALSATNANATVRYLQIHNKATAPATSDAPVAAWPIPAGSSTAPGSVFLSILDFGTAGYRCTTGIAIGISTTLATFTAATAADHIVNGSYV
jgi:hypothetical protein